jgi:hypothetical protein
LRPREIERRSSRTCSPGANCVKLDAVPFELDATWVKLDAISVELDAAFAKLDAVSRGGAEGSDKLFLYCVELDVISLPPLFHMDKG